MATWSRSLIIRLADGFEKKIVREKENINDFEKKIRTRLLRRISGWSWSEERVGCDRAHKDFCNLGGTNRRLDRRRDLIKLYTLLNYIVTDVVIQ